MQTKKMKVHYSWGTRTTTPKIQMEGKWLESLGFHIGDAIEVAFEENCIRITPAPQLSMVCESQPEYPSESKGRKQRICQ